MGNEQQLSGSMEKVMHPAFEFDSNYQDKYTQTAKTMAGLTSGVVPYYTPKGYNLAENTIPTYDYSSAFHSIGTDASVFKDTSTIPQEVNVTGTNNGLLNYANADSGILGLTNGQIGLGLNIANTALSAANLGLGWYYGRKNYKLQKQALQLQKDDLAYNQQVQYNKAVSSANVLAGMGKGVEGFDADANMSAVKQAYSPTIK